MSDGSIIAVLIPVGALGFGLYINGILNMVERIKRKHRGDGG